ncbi:unnamed protein product, partial [Phaeothamnion confervicola]
MVTHFEACWDGVRETTLEAFAVLCGRTADATAAAAIAAAADAPAANAAAADALAAGRGGSNIVGDAGADGGGGSGGQKMVAVRRARYSEPWLPAVLRLGASYVDTAAPAAEVVKRARGALVANGAWSGYNILTNNCEHFCQWAVTGKRPSL